MHQAPGSTLFPYTTLFRSFLTTLTLRRPHVTLKAAVSLDGRLGAPGVRTRLTGAAANRRVHRQRAEVDALGVGDRKSTRLNSSHSQISYAVFCLKKKSPGTD